MKKNNLFTKVALAALLVLSAVAFSSCKADPEEDYSPSELGLIVLDNNHPLVGTWASGYGELFTIKLSEFSAKDTYTIENTFVYELTESSGYIYGQYTEIYDWAKGQTTEPDNTDGWLFSYGKWYPTNKALIGKWYAVYYEKLTSTSVTITAAYKDGGKSVCKTLKEALEEFTVEKGYFAPDYPSECTKQ